MIDILLLCFQMSPPHSLEELLQDFSDTNLKNAQEAMKSHYWCQRLAEHLKKLDMKDELIALKFLVYTQNFQKRLDKETSLNNNAAKERIMKESRKELTDLFFNIADMFFSEESKEQLLLSNGELFRSICSIHRRESKRKKGRAQEGGVGTHSEGQKRRGRLAEWTGAGIHGFHVEAESFWTCLSSQYFVNTYDYHAMQHLKYTYTIYILLFLFTSTICFQIGH